MESLGSSPALFPYDLDLRGDSMSLLRLDRNDYSQASFLDGRILQSHPVVQSLPWSQAARAIESAQLTERCHLIFHIGHVGSTLLARLIGAHPHAFALREPQILRTLAQWRRADEIGPRSSATGGFEERLAGCLKLLSRTFDIEQRAVVKTTSFVSEMAAELLSRSAKPKAVMMYVTPECYLATIMAGPNSRQEAKMLMPVRLQRLARRLGGTVSWRIDSLSEGEALALGWACEMTALAAAARVAGERVMCLDFDRFLRAPAQYFPAVLHHLDIAAGADEVSAILGGPEMSRYSKAPQFAYDTALRDAVLNEARAVDAAEIRRGLRWLERAAAEHPMVREAIGFGLSLP